MSESELSGPATMKSVSVSKAVFSEYQVLMRPKMMVTDGTLVFFLFLTFSAASAAAPTMSRRRALDEQHRILTSNEYWSQERIRRAQGSHPHCR